MTSIANLPKTNILDKYVVARNTDGDKWWYWGTYDDLNRATNAAKEIDGSIFEKDDVMEDKF